MKKEVNKKYLVFPVNNFASRKSLKFSLNGQTVYSLNINLDNINPDFYAYVDVSRFMGEELEISVSPEMDIKFRESDTMDIDGLYQETYRPQIHFSTKNGWLNDPNGLLYLDGIYHMFYQYNPCSTEHVNMHWGHATSPDLIHWEEKDIALFPDETGEMFSGSAMTDWNNVTGLGKDGIPASLLFYTATNPHMQYMAYSTDGFKTIQKRKEHIVPNMSRINRDPKVMYSEEMEAYIMALYLENDTYALLVSNDLTNWNHIQSFTLAGDKECPDIFPITDNEGNRKWVILGARSRYLVGEMKKDVGFVQIQEVLPLHFGDSAYAGQSYAGLPEGRIIRVDWVCSKIITPRFKSQMSIPAELKLENINGIYYLSANPVHELSVIYDQNALWENVSISGGSLKKIELECKPYNFKIKADDLDSGAVVAIRIFGRELLIKCEENCLRFGKHTLPLSILGKGLDLNVIVDKLSFEVYLDGGKVYGSFLNNNSVCDYNVPYLEIASNKDILINSIESHTLRSIW